MPSRRAGDLERGGSITSASGPAEDRDAVRPYGDVIFQGLMLGRAKIDGGTRLYPSDLVIRAESSQSGIDAE